MLSWPLLIAQEVQCEFRQGHQSQPVRALAHWATIHKAITHPSLNISHQLP